ncbi:glycoside hydrolase family 2 protein [Emticicia sp. 17c]|uniref:glycoside hydrolase family 2 protein n=1 Tax=Emticicia sp. 17c TaxID=3127704 RepID=UPI00301D4199
MTRPDKLLCLLFSLFLFTASAQENIPLPEHPRPDFERADWQNLNGNWAFEFDKNDVGLAQKWQASAKPFTKTINVPFPWGAPLSGVKDEADIAWYKKQIVIKPEWKGKRVFVTIGASDWKTTVWLDGKELGSHQGGYTPFSFELTNIKYGAKQNLVIRVDDKRRDFTLYGKQGYGNARGLWQTIYLEARGQNYIENLHFTPDIDKQELKVTTYLAKPAPKDIEMTVNVGGDRNTAVKQTFPKGKAEYSFIIPMPSAHLWELEDPYLYDVTAKLGDDLVKSYFGMRKISTVYLPGTNYKYVALNNKPVYLQLTLDQSYHPEGFYTFPTDEFMKNEILIARNLGLNGIRTHIKVDVPRKLYWADKLGVLVMSDLPNSWGEPDKNAQQESEYTLKEMIKRDFNHPAIFSWITFNETWGLKTKKTVNGKTESVYTPETQKWVASVYRLAKSLDNTRLVEDNSICCGAGHTETDINSWHEYLPGWAWEDHLKSINDNTFVGSDFHYEKGYKQTDVPNINSECGNVWGYEGSTGDCDWSWDYHQMMNTFRKYPKIAGWLYTEHHDVINEWNGYVRFDRSEKETGVGEMVKGMSIRDFHAPFYISTGNEISKTVQPNELITVPLYASFMTDRTDVGSKLTLKINMYGYDALGQEKTWSSTERTIDYQPWLQKALDPIDVKMPNEKAVVTMSMVLLDNAGNELHHNMMNFIVDAPTPDEMVLLSGKKAKLVSVEPKNFKDAKWSLKQWNVLDGLKVNGAGNGYFEYVFKVPSGVDLNRVESIAFVAEAGAKELFAKDMDKKLRGNENYMLGEKADPVQNQNAYGMTDTKKFPSAVAVNVNGVFAGRYDLPDDPSDHRGVLSWHNQLRDKKLREAGSYGYRLSVNIPQKAIEEAKKTGRLVVKLEVPESMNGGLAIYGDKFGRYPINPTIAFVLK